MRSAYGGAMSADDGAPRLREAVRALILDAEDNVLLVRFVWPWLDHPEHWACPGGGLDAGESVTDALRREVREEAGLVADEIGPMIWEKTAIFAYQGFDGQHDAAYLVRVDHVEPVPALTVEQLADENLHGIRWWSPEEIAAAHAAGTRFSPRSFPGLFAALRRDGPPAHPPHLRGI